jgi:hypothetical protein
MTASSHKTIELQPADWSEVTPPTIGGYQSKTSLTRRFMRHAAVAVMSAALGFAAYDLDQDVDVDLDFDYEHPELSTTANIAPEALARIEMSDSVAGYRVSVAHNVTTDDRTPISDGSLAFLDVRKR